jgi:hypothetical protein
MILNMMVYDRAAFNRDLAALRKETIVTFIELVSFRLELWVPVRILYQETFESSK